MPFVLRKGFTEGRFDLRAARGAPTAAAFEVLVDAVLFEEPVSLARVAGEHLQFEIERCRDVEDELWLDRATEPVGGFDGIDEVQVWDVIGRGNRLPLASCVVRNARIETGVSKQLARDLVVRHVIDWRSGHHDVGADSAKDFGHAAASVVVVRDAQVAEFQTDVISTEQISGRFRFRSTDGGDFVTAHFGGTAVARRHRGDRDCTPFLLQQRECPGTLKFNIVGMSVNGEHSRSGN